jgi:SAM-dependent methyltransferase
MDRGSLAYWDSGHAGPVRPMAAPIVPAAEDTAFLEDRVLAAAGGRPVDALLLGMTRSIATLRWPAGSSLVAVEWSSAMMRRFWPKEGLPRAASLVRADWRELPLAASSRDVAAGDGCYSVLASLEDAALLNREVQRVLRPGGSFYMRCFARPERGFNVGGIFDALRSGRIANVFLLQWLLAMAVHGDTREGVALDAVWRAWKEGAPRPRELFARCGWPEDSAWTFERWKGVAVRYSFPTAVELGRLAAPLFDVVQHHVPSYPWGECFPSLVMQPRK